MENNDLYDIYNQINGERYSLYSLATWKNGLAFKNIHFSESGLPVIKISELNNGITETTAYTKEIFSKDIYLTYGDFVFAWSGNPDTSIDIFKYRLPDGWLNQHIFKVVPNSNVDRNYFFYIMKYLKPNFQKIARNKQTTGLGHVTISDLQRITLCLPPLPVQQKIASILGSLDDKIELNNRMIANLEEQAYSTYKSWFTEFAQWGGVKPSGWRSESIYSITNIIYGAPFKSNLFNTFGNGRPVIRIRDLKSQEFVTYTTEKHPKEYLIKKGDLVVGMDGEFRPYIWGNEDALLNQRVCVFKPKRERGSFFLYFTLKPQLEFIEQTEAATTVIHIGKNDFDKFIVDLPDDETLDEFDGITQPMYDRIVKNRLENKRLAELRDTLLPKLMSGEIDVEDIEI